MPLIFKSMGGGPYIPPPDTTPNAFTFTDQTGVALSGTMTSAAISVTGIDAPATITVSGGTYDINASGSFTSSSGSVTNGDTVRARHTSSGSNSTAVNTVVTIGGVSDTFTSTTLAGSSDLTHGASFTVTGTGFGSKTIRETVRDTADHGQAVTARWSGYWPTAAGAGYDLHYTTPATLGRGIAVPHSRLTHYLAGCHLNENTSTGGNNVAFWRTFTRTLGDWSYWSWYERSDPSMTHGDDDNWKTYGYSIDGSIYELPNNWYIAAEQNQFNNNTSTFGHITNDDSGSTGLSPAVSYWYNSSGSQEKTNPGSAWVHGELLVNWQSGSTGSLREWYDNEVMFAITGSLKTDGYAGSTRSEGLGGYYRNRSSSNFRYYTDITYHRATTPGRFVLTNNATYASSTITAMQTPTSWSSTSVDLTCNGGALSSGTVHLHFRDESGSHQYIGTRTLA